MATGTIKWFNAAECYGFIVPDEPGPDVFVHQSQIVSGRVPREGQKVRYEVKTSPKGPLATCVEIAMSSEGFA